MKRSSISKLLDTLKKSIFGDLLNGVEIDEDSITSEELSELIAQLSREKNKGVLPLFENSVAFSKSTSSISILTKSKLPHLRIFPSITHDTPWPL